MGNCRRYMVCSEELLAIMHNTIRQLIQQPRLFPQCLVQIESEKNILEVMLLGFSLLYQMRQFCQSSTFLWYSSIRKEFLRKSFCQRWLTLIQVNRSVVGFTKGLLQKLEDERNGGCGGCHCGYLKSMSTSDGNYLWWQAAAMISRWFQTTLKKLPTNNKSADKY